MQVTVLQPGCEVVCVQTLSFHPLFLLHDVPKEVLKRDQKNVKVKCTFFKFFYINQLYGCIAIIVIQVFKGNIYVLFVLLLV